MDRLEKHKKDTIKWFGKLFCCSQEERYLKLVEESYDELFKSIGGMVITSPPRDAAFSLAGGILAVHFEGVLKHREKVKTFARYEDSTGVSNGSQT